MICGTCGTENAAGKKFCVQCGALLALACADAQWARFRARLDVRKGEIEHVESRFKGAVGSFREISFPFYLAATLLDYGAWLVNEGRPEDAEPLFDEGRGIFERLGTTPWLEHLDAVAGERSTVG